MKYDTKAYRKRLVLMKDNSKKDNMTCPVVPTFLIDIHCNLLIGRRRDNDSSSFAFSQGRMVFINPYLNISAFDNIDT